MGAFDNLLGKKFNRLTVVGNTNERYSNGGYKWICKCDCGNDSIVRGDSLKSGHIKSCGCLNSELTSKRAFKHGQNNKQLGRTKEYDAWRAMINRCNLKSTKKYHRYGARGISVCDRWLNSFENFFEDMGKKPTLQHSLDRYPDINGNYEPSNCRWATNEQQSRNKSTNVWIEYNGERLIITDWAKKLNTRCAQINKMLKRGKNFDYVYNFYKNKNK